jgi:tetratricopeptide (TPR) repeat protein
MKRNQMPRQLDLVELRRQLFAHSRYHTAIARLKSHLAISPLDEDAQRLLLDCYVYLEDWPSALAWSDKLLAIDPAHPDAWYAKSSALLNLGDIEGAVASAKTGLKYAEDLGDEVENAYLDRDSLLGALWRSLMAAARYEEALAVARNAPPQDAEDPETWVIESLLALRRFHEAEALVASHSDDLPFCTWRIAVLLGHQGQFDDALVYLRQRLAFIAQPATKDFLYVCTHAECLAHLGDVRMLEAIVAFWRNRRLSRLRMYTLLILRIIAVSATNRQSAVQMIRDWQDSVADRTIISKIRLSTVFESTYALWISLVTEALLAH